jgi:mitogen-activated protein kinase kinase
MLLQHAWFAPLVKPAPILEEDEDEDEQTPPSYSDDTLFEEQSESVSLNLPSDVVDQEVAEWVSQALEKRRQGKLGKSAKPALHAAPLDVVKTPESHPGVKLHESPNAPAPSAQKVDSDDNASTTMLTANQ